MTLYIKHDDNNYPILKEFREKDKKSLSLDECIQSIEAFINYNKFKKKK